MLIIKDTTKEMNGLKKAMNKASSLNDFINSEFMQIFMTRFNLSPHETKIKLLNELYKCDKDLCDRISSTLLNRKSYKENPYPYQKFFKDNIKKAEFENELSK